jgi:hypothetical protein
MVRFHHLPVLAASLVLDEENVQEPGRLRAEQGHRDHQGRKRMPLDAHAVNRRCNLPGWQTAGRSIRCFRPSDDAPTNVRNTAPEHLIQERTRNGRDTDG